MKKNRMYVVHTQFAAESDQFFTTVVHVHDIIICLSDDGRFEISNSKHGGKTFKHKDLGLFVRLKLTEVEVEEIKTMSKRIYEQSVANFIAEHVATTIVHGNAPVSEKSLESLKANAIQAAYSWITEE